MKNSAHWREHDNGLIYSGLDYLGIIQIGIKSKKWTDILPPSLENIRYTITYAVAISEGMGKENYKTTNFIYFDKLSDAIKYVEEFFELDIKKQRSSFKKLCREKGIKYEALNALH